LSEEVTVRILNEERANLVCYFLRSILRRSAAGGAGGGAAGKLAGSFECGVKVVAGGMTAYVYGTQSGIEISPVERGVTGVGVEGELGDLLRVMIGGGAVVPYLRGDIRVKGSPLRALRVLRSLRTPEKRTG